MNLETIPYNHSVARARAHLEALLPHHESLRDWILETAALTQPQSIVIYRGNQEEYEELCKHLVRVGTFRPLNPEKRPRSFLAWSDPTDVARVENRTFVCTPTREEAGPNNNWQSPEEMKRTLISLFRGSMQGRTMYVIPFCMGPLNSPLARFGVEITDSPYVVVNMHLMTRVGSEVLDQLRKKTFVKALHSVGKPLGVGEKDVSWPCHPEKYIVHFPQDTEIWSFGSGYGGNALLGKKCLSLRLGSYMAKQEGWLAEHMLIMGVENPQGEKRYLAAAFPSACGKTNFAMLVPPKTYSGWKITTIGDDIAWMFVDQEGVLRALNPEFGFFGVAPGTSWKTNPIAMQTIQSDTIFTNVALTPDGDVWWEGLTHEPPQELLDWCGKPWNPHSGSPAAHPNARFTVNIRRCPSLDPNWNHPQGVPISALLFGGRRARVMPLVFQTSSWQEGVYWAATIGSETTAAAVGTVGVVRRDPMAMLPFCGYNMAQYFNHWLQFEKKLKQVPPIYLVNWFRKNSQGAFLWPGFGENIRVIDWIFREKKGHPGKHFFGGYLPQKENWNFEGLSLSESDWAELFQVDLKEWIAELDQHEEFFRPFGGQLPESLWSIHQEFRKRLELSLVIARKNETFANF